MSEERVDVTAFRSLERLVQEQRASLEARIARVEERLEALGGEPSPEAMPEQAQRDILYAAWKTAPRDLRLKFARELLPGDDPLQPALKEAAAMEDLRQRGDDLEAWIERYPALFIEAVERMHASGAVSEAPPSQVALSVLAEARAALDACLKAMGVEWLAPEPGEPLTPECEVVGEEESDMEPGSVARRQRRGFRREGRMMLPAQVLRSIAPPTQDMTTDASEESAPGGTEPPTVVDAGGEHLPGPGMISPPDWLRTLQQRAFGEQSAAIGRLMGLLENMANVAGQGGADDTLRAALEPLLPLLGPRYTAALEEMPAAWGAAFEQVVPEMLAWLKMTADVTIFLPAGSEPFDPETMEAVGVRRTAHAHEDGAIARVERVGLRRGERTLLRAQVVRYERGGGA